MSTPLNMPGSDTQDFYGPGWTEVYTGQMGLDAAVPNLPDHLPPPAGVSQMASIPDPNQLLYGAAQRGEVLNFADLQGFMPQ